MEEQQVQSQNLGPIINKYDDKPLEASILIDMPDEANGWSTEIEKGVNEIAGRCDEMHWRHEKCAKYYGKGTSIFGHITGAILNIGGLLLIVTSGLALNNRWLNLAIGAVLTIAGAALHIYIYKIPINSAYRHHQASSEFLALAINARKQFALKYSDRMIGKEYLEWLSRTFNDIYSHCPIIQDDASGPPIIFQAANIKSTSSAKDVPNDKILQYELERNSYLSRAHSVDRDEPNL